MHDGAVRRVVLLTVSLAGCSLQTNGLGAQETFEAASADTEVSGSEEAATLDSAVATDAVAVDTETADTAPADTGVEPEGGVMLTGCAPASYGGHSYLFCERAANWDQARTTCQFAGLDLVVVGDAAENDFLTKAIAPAKSSDFYIGLDDQVKEGDYTWVDGSKPGYTHWSFLEPNDFFGEDCCILTKAGSWNDVDCIDSASNAFICESK
jgi:hypothetical protein